MLRRALTLIPLAAAPAFAGMAVWTATAPGPGALCLAGAMPFAPDGMAFMYALMSVVHLPAWLRAMGAASFDSPAARAAQEEGEGQ